MKGFKLFFQLWLKGLSFKKNSLRYPRPKRLTTVFLIIPILGLHILTCRFFLWLDTLFFPAFKKIDTENCLFIVGKPRSGTSFLLQLIAEDEKYFTAFSLWELVFAPSIIQKKIILALSKLDKTFGGFLGRQIERLDSILFTRMQGIHDLSLFSKEEDEFLFLYIFQSVYLLYLFPELDHIHSQLKTDLEPGGPNRLDALQFYQRCVQRHLYVFDRAQKKWFLSKNPVYHSKLNALTKVFPNAFFIHLFRPLIETIPSTISLNKTLFQVFSIVRTETSFRADTIEVLKTWEFAFNQLLLNDQWIKIEFAQLTRLPSQEIFRLYEFLKLSMTEEYHAFLLQMDVYTKNYKSQHTYPPLTKQELAQILP